MGRESLFRGGVRAFFGDERAIFEVFVVFFPFFALAKFAAPWPRYRKGLERASITVPKALITWLTEEAAV